MSLVGEPVVILGTFRGGTSCLATALVSMGLYMGEPTAFQRANEFNKGGFWELEDMQALNAQALVVYGMGYLGADHMHADWLERPESEYFVSQVGAILEKHFSNKPYWGWKEPGTTSLFPLYKHAMREHSLRPIYPIMVRHPLSVAFSRKRQFLIKNADGLEKSKALIPPDEQRALGMWVDYTLVNLFESKGSPRMVVSYEDLLENPAENLERVAKIMPWNPTQEQIGAAVDTINPEWSHSRFSASDLDPWPSIVARTYDLCLRASRDANGLNEGLFDGEIDTLWQEWQMTSNMSHSLQMPPGHLIATWREGDQVQHHDEPFTPNGSWQKLKCNVSGNPGETVHVTLYQMPCQAWIGRAVWNLGEDNMPAALMAGPGGMLEQAGKLRLTSYGSGALAIKIPENARGAELEIDFLLLFDMTSVSIAANMAKARLDAARRTAQRTQ